MLWEEIQKLYPAAAIANASPYNFFGKDERITLQRTKVCGLSFKISSQYSILTIPHIDTPPY